MSAPVVRYYGWRPSPPDFRDHVWAVPAGLDLTMFPPRVDLTAQCPPIYDQGKLSSCTANAVAALIQYLFRKQGLSGFTPSRIFIYYGERALEGTIGMDSGASLADGIKVAASLGVPPETLWPYLTMRFATRPPATVYTAALDHKIRAFQRVNQTVSHMRAVLALGFPFVFGVTIYQSFESAAVARTGIVPMPSASESVLGGHAMLAVGYDDTDRRVLLRNSWGTGWGQAGYGTIPYDYLTNRDLGGDFWTAQIAT